MLCGGDPVGQRLSRHVTEEEEEDEEAGGGVMVESGWGEPGRTIKMSLAAGKRRRRVVPSVRIGQRREKRRRRWWWWRRTAAYTDEDPVGEFMRRPNKALNGHTSREASKNPAQGNRVAQLQK